MNGGHGGLIPVESGPDIGLVDIRRGFGRREPPAIDQPDIWQVPGPRGELESRVRAPRPSTPTA
jgi:hypothetical protein